MKLRFKADTKLIVFVSSLISICLVLFVAFNANRYISRMSKNNSELYSAYRISELMKSLRSNIIIMENKQKGYLMSGDGKFLEEYKIEETETKTYLKSLENYFSGKPEEELFYKLKDLTYKKIMQSKDLKQGQTLAGFRGDNADADLSVKILDEIKITVDEINESLNKTTKVLLDNSVEYVRISKQWSFLVIAIGIIVAFIAVLMLFRDINLRNKLNEELRFAKKLADDNAVMKEQFMANMSHEIRTPMNAILGFTDLLQKTKFAKPESDYLTAIKTSGANLLNIINDILDFSKIEAGKLSIEKIPFSIPSIIDSLRIMFETKASEKNISFEVTLAEKVPAFVFGDPTRLTQILVNLTNNAIKFTNEGTVRLSCELKSIEHNVVQLVFRVKDTGIGIAPDKLGDVFERFNQGNKETTRKFGGTGLGLAIVKSLVEIQNGDISVKSKLGIGSEFSVIMSYPVSYETNADQQNTIQPELPKISDGSLKVLLAEDNALNQKLAVTYLTGFGLQVDIAENGAIALEKLKAANYALVLMDIQMPVLDGYNTAQKIREELKSNIPVVAMTAHIMEREREKCISYGMNDYISKPFKESVLHAVVLRNIQVENHAPGSKENSVQTLTGLDLEDLYTLSRGNRKFIKEMIELFIERNPTDIDEIKTAIEKSDFETIAIISHRMKTSVGFMGLKSQLSPLNEMETLAEKKRGLPQIYSLFQSVKKECEGAIIILEKELLKLEKINDQTKKKYCTK